MPFSRPHSLDLPEEVQDLLTRYASQIKEDWSADLGGLLLFGSAARGDFIWAARISICYSSSGVYRWIFFSVQGNCIKNGGNIKLWHRCS